MLQSTGTRLSDWTALSIAPPFRTRPRFSHSQSFPSVNFRKPYLSEGRKNVNHNHRKLTKLITWITALSNSMKLWALLCRATQDRRVIVESSGKMRTTGEGNGKLLQCSCLENHVIGMKRQKDRTLKDELPRSVGAQYATGEEWRKTPERMKRWSQSENNIQLWMWLVMEEAKSNAVKNNNA